LRLSTIEFRAGATHLQEDSLINPASYLTEKTVDYIKTKRYRACGRSCTRTPLLRRRTKREAADHSSLMTSTFASKPYRLHYIGRVTRAIWHMVHACRHVQHAFVGRVESNGARSDNPAGWPQRPALCPTWHLNQSTGL